MTHHESPTLPRTYRSAAAYRTMCRWTAGLTVAVILYGILGRVMGWVRNAGGGQFAFFSAALFLIAVFLWVQSTRTATIEGDSITVKSVAGSRTLRRSEIGSRYFVQAGYRRLPMHVLVPADRSARPMKLPPSIHSDHELQAWLNDIPLKGDGNS